MTQAFCFEEKIKQNQFLWIIKKTIIIIICSFWTENHQTKFLFLAEGQDLFENLKLFLKWKCNNEHVKKKHVKMNNVHDCSYLFSLALPQVIHCYYWSSYLSLVKQLSLGITLLSTMVSLCELQSASLHPLVPFDSLDQWRGRTLSSYHRCTATSTLLLIWITGAKPAMPSWYFGELMQLCITPIIRAIDKSSVPCKRLMLMTTNKIVLHLKEVTPFPEGFPASCKRWFLLCKQVKRKILQKLCKIRTGSKRGIQLKNTIKKDKKY